MQKTKYSEKTCFKVNNQMRNERQKPSKGRFIINNEKVLTYTIAMGVRRRLCMGTHSHTPSHNKHIYNLNFKNII